MFFSGGGFPFGGEYESGHGHLDRARKEVDNKRFYEVLGVDKDSSAADVKKAYRKLAIQHHPDKGGDPDAFKDISRAYEVLSDPEKRDLYDKHGEDGLDGSGGAEAHDIFDLFFGGSGRRKGPPQKKKGENITSPLKVTLAQLYKGATRKLAVNRDVICPQCDGVGGPLEAIEKCHTCDGAGVRVQIRQMGPMIQQIQSKCGACNGEGSSMPSNKKCTQCKGHKTVKERKVVQIYVEPGAPNRHKCVFKGEADHRPGEDPGDVVFVLEEQEHSLYKRKNVDLFVEREITLIEALTGYKFLIESLDDRKLLIQTPEGEVTKPGDVRCVRHEGMPTHRSPFVKGDLFIVFTIVFPLPEQIRAVPNAANLLKKLLPNPEPLMLDEESEEFEHHYVENIKPQDRSHGGRGEAYDEDEDNQGGGQGVQCRQQ